MSTADPRPAASRRTILVAATITGATVAGVGACGTADSGPDDSRPAGPPSASPTRPAQPVATAEDIPVGGGRIFPDVPVVVTQPAPGEFRGFGIVCTHDRCELTSVSGGTINCPCHGSRFAITDGSVVRGPARTGLRTEAVAVQDGRIVLL